MLCIVWRVAHPLFHGWPGRGKIALRRFDVSASEGDTAPVKCFRNVARLRKFFERSLSQNLIGRGIIPLKHRHVPAPRTYQSRGILTGRNALQSSTAGSRVTVTKHFKIGQADPGKHATGTDLQRAIKAGSSSGPVPHKEIIVAGGESGVVVERIERAGALEAGYRFAPAPLPAIDLCNVVADLCIVGRTRECTLEFLKSYAVVPLVPETTI